MQSATKFPIVDLHRGTALAGVDQLLAHEIWRGGFCRLPSIRRFQYTDPMLDVLDRAVLIGEKGASHVGGNGAAKPIRFVLSVFNRGGADTGGG